MNEQLFPFFFFLLDWTKAGKTGKGKKKKKGESCFKQSHELMNGDSNTQKKKKRDISGIILPPLLPATVVSDEAWLRRAERREVISLTERLWFFTLMRGESRRGGEMKTVRMKGAAHHPRKRKSINRWQSQNAVVMLSDRSGLAGLITDLKSLINKREKEGPCLAQGHFGRLRPLSRRYSAETNLWSLQRRPGACRHFCHDPS